MKFIMFVKDSNKDDSTAWEESEDRPLKPLPETEEGARQWAEKCIAQFNATLRPHERPRTLLRVEMVVEGTSRHDWTKVSLVTEKGGFDRMACIVCGLTGRRYGFGDSGIRFDAKFKAKKWLTCNAANKK